MKRTSICVPCFLVLGVVVLLVMAIPQKLSAQALARQALACFPPDTQQLAYANLAQLRSLPNYRQLRRVIFSRQMQNFEAFLRPLGADVDRDVDEVAIGWRGTGDPVFFGLAEGQFQPDPVQSLIAQEKLPTSQYEGYTLDAFGSGIDRNGLFFTFFSPNLAAFGRLSDLKALIDGYLGLRPALNTNTEFVNWEGQIEGSGPEWGITTGKAAANLALPWLLPGAKRNIDLSSILSPIKAVLYSTDWGTDFSAQISIICHGAESASTLAQLLTLWRNSVSTTPSQSSDANQLIQSMEITLDGNQVELSGFGPTDALAQVLQHMPGR
ncbi:MAG: hypothetical protein ACRD2B_16360 [Terriglobia bacterium]